MGKFPYNKSKLLMKTKNAKRMVAALLALVSSAATVACAADQYQLAYTDTIVQDGVKIQSTGGQIIKSGPSVTAGSVAADIAQMSFAQQTTLKVNGRSQTVILRRLFPAGDGGTTGQSDLLFSIQACSKVERNVEDANRLSCRDQPAADPLFKFGKVVLAVGQSVTVTFPEGIAWTYKLEPELARAAR